MASIQETLRSALGADPAVAALVGDRIYPGQIPADEVPTPWLYYAVPESVPFESIDDDVAEARHQVEFHALADTYAESKAIIDAVFAVLDTYVGGQIRRAFWEGTSEETTEEGYHHVARFTMWATSAVLLGSSGPRARITTGVSSITLYADGRVLTLDASGLLLDGQPIEMDLSYLTFGRVVYWDGSQLVSAADVSYSPTGTRLTVTNGPISCPGSGGSERFGASSSTGAFVQGTALGGNAAVTGNGGTAAGFNSSAGQDGVAVGRNTIAPAFTPVVGYNNNAGSGGGPTYGSDNTFANRSFGFGTAFASTGFDQFFFGRGNNFTPPAEHYGSYVGSSFDKPCGHTLTLFGGSSTVGRPLARLAAEWVTSTDATRKARVRHLVYDAMGTREGMRVESDGVQAMLSFFGATAVPRQAVVTIENGDAPNTGDANTDALIDNIRSRLNELIGGLGSSGYNLFSS